MPSGNISEVKSSNDTSLTLPTRIAITSIMFGFIGTTIFGNTLVVISVFKFNRLRSQMCFRFLCSLAITDICVAILVMQLSALEFLLNDWPFGWILCYVWMSFDVTCCTASILHLCVVAIDRYIAIAHGLHYSRLMTETRVFVSIVFIWLLSILISFVPIFADWFKPNQNSIEIIEQSCSLEVNKTYALISSMTSFYIPFLAIFCIYIKIYKIAKIQANKMRIESNCNRLECRKSRNDCKAIRTLGLIVGLFSVCWFPFFIMYVLQAFCVSCTLSKGWVIFITWIGYINSSLNPILYCFIQKEFRSSFIRLICAQHNCLCSILHTDILSISRDKHNSTFSFEESVTRLANLPNNKSQSYSSNRFE